MRLLFLLALVAAVGCDLQLGKRSTSPERRWTSCHDVVTCRAYVGEAEHLWAICPNDGDDSDCPPAYKELQYARELLKEQVRLAEGRARAQAEAEREAQKAEARQAEEDRLEQERRAALDAIRREEETAQRELSRLRSLDKRGREAELRRCLGADPDAGCGALLGNLLKAAADDAEKDGLTQLDEELRRKAASRQTAGGYSGGRENNDGRVRYLLCRDGTTSPSCVCGGPKRGCCSHHGGVAGCE